MPPRRRRPAFETILGEAPAHGRIRVIIVIAAGRSARSPTGVTSEDPPVAKLRIVIAL
jgi:hypothetical protein